MVGEVGKSECEREFKHDPSHAHIERHRHQMRADDGVRGEKKRPLPEIDGIREITQPEHERRPEEIMHGAAGGTGQTLNQEWEGEHRQKTGEPAPRYQ